MIQVIFLLAFAICVAFGLQWIQLNDRRRAAEERERLRHESVSRAFWMNRETKWSE